MDEELVSDSSVTKYGKVEEGGEDRPLSYASQFEEIFPWYLSIGMTPSQFWDEDCQLARYYREAERYREDKFNRQAHLQGLYFFEALCDVAPILHAFAEKGTKVHPYPEKPYELRYPGESEETEDGKSREQIQMEKNFAKMESFALEFNEKFSKKQEKEETIDARYSES